MPHDPHVFICYSRHDQPYARKLADDLRANGIEPWNDEDIEHGDRWWRTIVKAIDACAAFVVVMTPEAEESEWVEREILLAQREGKPLFPLLLRGKGHALLITTHHIDVTGSQMPPKATTGCGGPCLPPNPWRSLRWNACPKRPEQKRGQKRQRRNVAPKRPL